MIDWNEFNIWEFIPFLAFALVIIFVPTVLLPFFRFFSRVIIKKLKEEEPDINNAPKYATYLAQDIDGIWRWHDRKPILDLSNGCWYSTTFRAINYAGYTKPVNDSYKTSVKQLK